MTGNCGWRATIRCLAKAGSTKSTETRVRSSHPAQVPISGGVSGLNSTLAVAKIEGLPGSGKYLLTDAGASYPYSEELLAADIASCVSGLPADIVTSYQIQPTTGIDFEGGKLITVLLHTIYDLGGPPFNSINSSMSASPSDQLIDITLRSSASLTTTTPRPPAVGGITGVLSSGETSVQHSDAAPASMFSIVAVALLAGTAVAIGSASCWVVFRRRVR